MHYHSQRDLYEDLDSGRGAERIQRKDENMKSMVGISRAATRHLKSFPLWDASATIYVYERPNRYAVAGRHERTYFDLNIIGETCYVLRIGIDPEHRGKGFGKKLYEIIEAIAQDIGCSEIRMTPSGTTFTGESREDYLIRHGYAMDDGEAYKKFQPTQ